MNAYLHLLVTLSIASLATSECPPAETIAPCVCKNSTFYEMESLVCDGPQVTDLKRIFGANLNNTEGEDYAHFGELNITNTAITSIEAGSFGNAIFHSISIMNNQMLSTVDAHAFANFATLKILDVLDVINSTKLTSAAELFALVNYLQPKVEVSFIGLGITEIPDNAFSENHHLFIVSINDNPITRIGKSAFVQLKNVTTVDLMSNAIADIEFESLTFNETNPQDLLVILNSNNLTASSFHVNFFDADSDENADYEVNDNYIETLKESIFKPFILSDTVKTISLGGNDLICDCGLKWIIDHRNVTENKLLETYCSDKNDTIIFNLEPEDFGTCS